MEYNTFKFTIFNCIVNSSRTIIETYLERLAEDFNVPYNTVVQDYNKFEGVMIVIEYK
jgi:hypothetical protein